jgi:S-adenosylmethionine hydrolase
MILLFTDFGLSGPYVGQLKAVLHRDAPAGVPIVDLMHDAPRFDPRAAAYLLAALAPQLPAESIVVAVVDPGVGTERLPVVVRADRRWLVGPDNGLFDPVARRAAQPRCWRITLRPAKLSRSFHGRDLFAPVAARIAAGSPPPGEPLDPSRLLRPGWPADLAQVIYIDHYGNAVTGLRAECAAQPSTLRVRGHRLRFAPTFGTVPVGLPFWYINSIGLIEIAVNQGRADRTLGLAVGTPVELDSAVLQAAPPDPAPR